MNAQQPPMQRFGSAVLLQGAAVIEAHHLIAVAVRETTRRDGIRPSPGLRALMELLGAAATAAKAESRSGHGDVPAERDLSQSDPLDQITTKEAAEMLALSPRQVRRLAFDLGVRRSPTGAFTFDRAAVEAHAHRRKEKAA